MTDAVRWATPEFADELRAWVQQAVGPVRMEQVKLRAWSTVWRACAGHGTFYAKQGVLPNRFEAGLLEELAGWLPGSFVPVVAADRGSGTLLTPDLGPVLGLAHDDVGSWCRVVQEWASVQRALVARVEEIAALGVPVLQAGDTVPEVLARAAALNALPAGHPRRLDDVDRRRVEAAVPELRRAVEVVEDLGLPMTLDHNDLHGGNVLVGDGRVRFFDLGDALLAEPMAALQVPLGAYVEVVGCPTDDPRLHRIAEAWLEVWSDVAPLAELRRVLPSALRLARLARHEAWWRVVPHLEGADLGAFASAGTEWVAAMATPPLLTPDAGP